MKKKGNYRLCWEYLKSSKNYFWIMGGVFLLFILIGYTFPVFFVEMIEEFIKELVEQTAGMNFYQLFLFILQNNVVSSFFALLFGIVLGLFPLISAMFNGYVLGFVARKSVDVSGVGVLWRILPHGIFEIPALIISLGLGLRLGMSFFKRDVKKELKHNFHNIIRVFLFAILPLLILAAIIEAGLMIILP